MTDNRDFYKIHSGATAAPILFLSYMIIAAISFALTAAVFYILRPNGVCILYNPIDKSGIFRTVLSVVLSALPCTVTLAILFFSAYTAFSLYASCAVAVLKGASLGAILYFYVSGSLIPLSPLSSIAVSVYLLSAALTLFAAALSTVFSSELLRLISGGRKRKAALVSLEYLKLFLPISGGIYILSCASLLML